MSQRRLQRRQRWPGSVRGARRVGGGGNPGKRRSRGQEASESSPRLDGPGGGKPGEREKEVLASRRARR
jgi:hypothetical protein